ncbi:MAG: hypothetical protein WKG01_37140, partial [Kofleriaceae bacterium]
RWRLVGAAPLLAAAFYFRYGSAPVIAVIGLVAAIVWWRSILRRPYPFLAMGALLALLFVPHVLHSIDATGSWSGVLYISRTMPRRAYLGEGLVTYLTANPFVFYGALVAPVALVGLATCWRLGRVGWFLGLVAIGQLITIGINTHGQPRYVFFAAALLVVPGVATLAKLARPRLALSLVACAWLGVAIAVVPYNRRLAELRQPIVLAARAISSDAAGRPCFVVARIVPQLMWYAHCDGLMPSYLEAVPCPQRLPYVVSLPGHELELDAVLPGTGSESRPLRSRPGPARELPVVDPRVRVWALD